MTKVRAQITQNLLKGEGKSMDERTGLGIYIQTQPPSLCKDPPDPEPCAMAIVCCLL